MKKIKAQTLKATIEEPKLWNILKRQAAEFCRETGLHGYRYISQTQRSKTERITWVLVVFSSLCCAIILMKMTWNYYAAHPTLTVIESTHHGIWNYPFPAITVCNINRLSYNLTKEFVDNLKIPSNISRQFLLQEMKLLNELIVPGVFGYDVKKNLTRLQDIIDDNNLSILDVMKAITKNCSSLLMSCKWRGKLGPCDKHFKQSLSRDGLCCSFNYYTSPTITPNKIHKTAACGYDTGMTLFLNPEPNDYHASLIGSFGMKIMIHYSFDYPDYNAEVQLIRLNSQHFMSVNPAEMYSKPEVRNLAISTRKCIFNDEADHVYGHAVERNLSFTSYTYHNCLAECRATVARAKCGCIPFYFPQNSSRMCNLRDIQCLHKYNSFIDTSWPGFTTNLPFTVADIKQSPCGCLPDCSLYRYPIENSFGQLDYSVYYNNGSYTKNPSNAISIQNHSVLHVFFNDLVGFQYRRSVNYTWRNLFASFGGLLGLFAGFSLVCIFEFLYFFVIRVIIDTYISPTKHNNVQH
ncbi:PREDICTED: sodium channel protein Nach-like [Dinoponera quadriceps]|uniref:Sodium channel protein Nach-like n=1 Tax=Dinoponera quadriceps TaxID=609295 RepID=A0A6P3XL57_DINQU|nr:PREDICTED: sodium channel protein Nach-like [Dinoponera quadriceps]